MRRAPIQARSRNAGLAAAYLATCLACLVQTNTAQAGDQARTLAFFNIHTKETLTVTYRRNGRYVTEALERINWMFRDWRRNVSTQMDTKLLDVLWQIHRELGSRKPIHIISGYRSPKTNAHLRRTRGGQAKKSLHMSGLAADVQFPDVPLKALRYSALIREQGGVGYYPGSAIPFVHIDTGRVRAWPRLPRHELALLFPHGRTDHRPAKGGPLTRQDAALARAGHSTLATQIAAFHKFRRFAPESDIRTALLTSDGHPSARIPKNKRIAGSSVMASLGPMPKLVRQPKLAAHPKIVTPPRLARPPHRAPLHPSDHERKKLMQLAALSALPIFAPASRLASHPDRSAPLYDGKSNHPEGRTVASRDGTLVRFSFAAGLARTHAAADDDHSREFFRDIIASASSLLHTASIEDPEKAYLYHRAQAMPAGLLNNQ